MDLPMIITLCAALVLVGRLSDFLIGKSGNRWLKEHLIYRSWYSLQTFSPLAILRSAARLFESTTKLLFGERLFSLRAYVVSLCIGGLIGFLLLWFGPYTPQIRLTETPGLMRSPTVRGDPLWWVLSILVYLLVNPPFDFVSFAVTRYFATVIANSGRLLVALTLWFLDLICSFLIACTTFFAVTLFIKVFPLLVPYPLALSPSAPSSWPILGNAHDLSVTTAATGFVPVLIHFLFFIAFWTLALAEGARRGLSLVLDRFDESDDRPITIIATMLAAVIALLGAIQGLSGE